MDSPTDRLLVTIHGVAPENLPAAQKTIRWLQAIGRSPVTLTVNQEADWQRADIDVLRRMRDNGHELAGLVCRAYTPRNSKRGNGHGVPREAAGHRSHNGEDVIGSIHSCYKWFGAYGLGEPQICVVHDGNPRSVHRRAFATSGFRFVEYPRGILDTRTDAFRKLPRIRFDAESATRAGLLGLTNRWNLGVFHLDGWLRVAIRPNDRDRMLAADLEYFLLELQAGTVLPAELFDGGDTTSEAAPRDRSEWSSRIELRG